MRVLLVESHADTCELYAEYLGFVGYEVISAVRTDIAVAYLGHVDAVVTGINVSGSIDGLGLVSAIRSDPATATLPVIVLSASAYPSDVARATAAGCDRFLAKPCLPSNLASELDALMRARSRQMAKAPTRGTLRRRSA